MSFSVFAQPLTDQLTAYLNTLSASASVSMAVEPLADKTATASPSFFWRADVPVPSASVIKLPILVEAMAQVQAGTLDPDEIHILVDSEKAGGSGTLNTYPHRSRIAYHDLMTAMMIQSDNTATNIFINELGMEAINRRMQTMGLTQSRLIRVMMDTLAAKQGRENVVTAREMNALLVKIYRHELLTPALCEQMLGILKRNEDTLTIPRDLPPGTIVAHKTGELPYVRADVGIVYAKQPFVLSVLVQGVPLPDAERVIARIARLCFDRFNQ